MRYRRGVGRRVQGRERLKPLTFIRWLRRPACGRGPAHPSNGLELCT